MPRNNTGPATAANVPATVTGFSGTSLATLDLNRFRVALDNAERNIDTGGDKNYLRMNRAGVWVYGQNATEVEDVAEFAINPLGLEQGYIAWGQQAGRPLGQVMRSILQPPVQQSELPHVAAEWTQCVGIQLRCLTGEDAGMEFDFTSNSKGAANAQAELVSLIKAQLDLDPARIIPVVRLESDSYRHAQYGQIFFPVYNVLRWVAEDELPSFDAPAPVAAAATAAAPTPAAAQPAQTPATAPAAAVPAADAPRRGRGRPAAAPAAAAAAPAAAAAAPVTGGTRSRRRAG